MNSAKIFKNGQSQALRLPKEYRFKDKQVYIKKIGDIVLVFPKEDPWKIFVKSLDNFSSDFLDNRKQLPIQQRIH